MTASSRFTLAHFSDLHMPTRGIFAPRHWTVKRSLGYINWQTGRKRSFALRAVDLLVDDMRKRSPDHIAVTGDLVNFGLPSELESAARWLEALGPDDLVSVVPGNHDIYVPMRRDPGVARWIDYMRSDEYGSTVPGADNAFPDAGSDVRGAFPYVRRFGKIALIGVNSSLPMPPFIAAGELGPAQMQRLETVLNATGRDGLIRVLMIHHPPLSSLASQRRGLRDVHALAEVLKRAGAELILHGHNHTNTLTAADGPDRPIPIVGIAAGGMIKNRKRPEELGRYNLIEIIDAGSPSCQLKMTGYGLQTLNGPVVEVQRCDLTGADVNLGAIAGA